MLNLVPHLRLYVPVMKLSAPLVWLCLDSKVAGSIYYSSQILENIVNGPLYRKSKQ